MVRLLNSHALCLTQTLNKGSDVCRFFEGFCIHTYMNEIICMILITMLCYVKNGNTWCKSESCVRGMKGMETNVLDKTHNENTKSDK